MDLHSFAPQYIRFTVSDGTPMCPLYAADPQKLIYVQDFPGLWREELIVHVTAGSVVYWCSVLLNTPVVDKVNLVYIICKALQDPLRINVL